MICPHCKKENYNEKAVECAYCHQNMKEKPVASAVAVEQKVVQPVVKVAPRPVVTVEQPIQPVQEPKQKKKVNKKKVVTALVCVFVALILAGVAVFFGYVESVYKSGVSNAKTNPIYARNQFKIVYWYKDSKEQIKNQSANIYNYAKGLLEKGDFGEAERYLKEIPNYEGVDELYKEIYYQNGIYHFDRGEYATAKKYFAKTEGYKETKNYLHEFGCALRNDGSYQVKTYTGPGDNAYAFLGDTIFIVKYPDSDKFTYAIVKTKTKGKYLLCLSGEVVGDNVRYFDQATPICYFKNPKYDENGQISEFTSESISTGRETRYIFLK